MSAACPFCRIGSGAVAVHEVAGSDRLIAFMDRGPIRPGHLQIVPRKHFPYFDDLPLDLAAEVTALAQRLARAQKRLLDVSRVAFLFTGGDIPHAHAHLVPMVEKEDITSRRYIAERDLTFRPMPHPGDAALAEMADRIARAL